MSDLIVYMPNHGYADDAPVYVSWLDGVYYVDDGDQNSFKLATAVGGANVAFSDTITGGFIRSAAGTSGQTTITGLEHLEDQQVTLTNNGVYVGTYTVSGGSITVPSDIYNTYCVGIRYALKAKTMRLELPSVQGLQSRIKRIHETAIRCVRSSGGQLGQEYEGTEYLQDLNVVYSDASKDYKCLTDGGFSPDGYTVIRSSDPTPFTVLAAIISFSVDEP